MWTIEYLDQAERDFEIIFDHLHKSYMELGESAVDALERAAARVRGIRAAIDRLSAAPFVGTSRSDIHPRLRFVRREAAAVWFIPVEEQEVVRILAIFFGAQNHIRHMLVRMIRAPRDA